MRFVDTVQAFLKELGRFEYGLSCADRFWNLIFPDTRGHWNHVRVTQYRQTFYLTHIDGNTCQLEVVPPKEVKATSAFGLPSQEDGLHDPAVVWSPLIASARRWLKVVALDWTKANRRVQESYPINRRYGIVPHSLIRASAADVWRLDKELGKAKAGRFIRLVEEGYFHKEANTIAGSMTTNDYFGYCRTAYIAGRRKEDAVDDSLSGREMYKRYADGRHEGLLDIDADSKQAFAAWIDGTHPKRAAGGHPWEIKRGGDTTHIDLSVFRPSPYAGVGFKVELRGAAITRLTETIKMFLAIHDVSLPISIDDPEGIRMRLLAQDNIGLIPCYETLHGAGQHFHQHEHVYDVLHYDDLGRYKRRITPFITWEPLPILRTRNGMG